MAFAVWQPQLSEVHLLRRSVEVVPDDCRLERVLWYKILWASCLPPVLHRREPISAQGCI